MTMKQVILLAVILVCLTAVWMGRYDIVPASTPGGESKAIAAVYKLDRWTGRVWAIFGARDGRLVGVE